MEEKSTLGKFIAKKRKELNLTQKGLAEKLYVTESAVSKWERGVSYPDISLVSNLCSELAISEHELITASDDYQQRQVEQQAKHFRNVTLVYSWIFYLLYGISLLTCFICNLAIDHTLSWFYIVLTSEMVAFSLTSLPALCKKHTGLFALGGFYLSLNMLLLVCAIYSGGSWFFITFISLLFAFSVVFLPFILKDTPLPVNLSGHKTLICFVVDTILLFVLLLVCFISLGDMTGFFRYACPCALISLIFPWVLMVIIRYVSLNGMLRTSICLLVSGVFSFFFVGIMRYITNDSAVIIERINLLDWSQDYISGNVLLVTSLTCIIFSLIFAVGGTVLAIKKQKQN